MEPSKVVQEYKNEITTLKAKNDEYAKTVGQLTVEYNWMQGKSPRLNLINNDTNSNNIFKNYYILEVRLTT